MEWEGTYEGVALNYLAQRHNKDEMICFIRTPNQTLNYLRSRKHQLLWWAVLELQPSRGFLCKRVVVKSKNGIFKLRSKATSYFGCPSPEKDYLYRTELENDERDGLI